MRANPNLRGNPNLITAGRTYVIPDLAPSPVNAAAPVNAAPVNATTPAPSSAVADAQPASARTEGRRVNGYAVYTVKAGDSLWKIAREQLGSPEMVGELKRLNNDVLRGSDTVRISMQLKLPTPVSRSVAAAE